VRVRDLEDGPVVRPVVGPDEDGARLDAGGDVRAVGIERGDVDGQAFPGLGRPRNLLENKIKY